MSPRIFIDLSLAPPGGAATYVEGFARGLIESRAGADHDIVVVIDRRWAAAHHDLVSSLEQSDVEVVRHNFPTPGSWKGRLSRGPRLAALARSVGADVAFIPRDVASNMSIPYVTLARNLHAWQTFGSRRSGRHGLWARLRRLQARRSTRRAAAVLAVSRQMAAAVDGPVTGIVHHGCSLPEHPRSSTVSDTGSIVVAVVANLIESKGIEDVLRAVAKVSREGTDIELRVYGGRLDEAYAAEMEALSEELLGRSVLLGPRYGEDLQAAYHGADVLVVGSSFESFCHPLVEAMRSGCVVVAPRSDLVEELCGPVAIAFDMNDVDDLARALIHAIDERPERSRAGIERGREFTWGRTVEQTLTEVVKAVTPRLVSSPDTNHAPTGRGVVNELPRRVVVLWSRPSQYLTDCLDAMRRFADVATFYSVEGLAGVDASSKRRLGRRERSDLITPQTDVVIVGGWRNISYLWAAWRARRAGVATVLALDTQLSGRKQQMQIRIVGVLLTRIFSHVFVPGDRQLVVARILGFAGSRTYTGLYASREGRSPSGGGDPGGEVVPRSFLWVGRLVPVKGVDVLVDAYRRYRAEVDDPWDLRVAGRGPLDVLLDGAADGIVPLGVLKGEEVYAEMSRAAALVSSSTYEPWGMVIAEAAAHHLPVICTSAAGAGDDLVIDGESGYVATAGDAMALSRAMVRMHTATDEERRKMGERSAELAAAFTPDTWVRQVIGIHRDPRGFGSCPSNP